MIQASQCCVFSAVSTDLKKRLDRSSLKYEAKNFSGGHLTRIQNVAGSSEESIDCFHDPIMQYVLGGSLHKNNTIYLPLGLYHASVN